MEALIAEHELIDSCRVLFGADLQISRGFLEYLQHAGIKSAYRKKALETHPDMLADRGEEAKRKSADLFRLVHQAYANLTTYLHARENGFRFPEAAPRPWPRTVNVRPAAPQSRPAASASGRKSASAARAKPPPAAETNSRRARAASAWQGPQTPASAKIPARRLLFGHYLYYSGLATWQTIVKALVWQRTGRPRLGEIGRRFGWLNEEDILFILKRRSLAKPFGSAAVELGLLTEGQVRLMLFQQGRLQRKFGQYFVVHHLLTPAQLTVITSQFFRHNAAFAGQEFSSRARCSSR
ncbi:MAG: J domain-containing protein [Desulfobacteraceae bacterium]|nr:J domain-containing protein [Desulfobacteraceae bacterium]